MHVIKMNAVAKKSYESPLFTGPEVSRQTLLPDSNEFNVNISARGFATSSTPTPASRFSS